MTIVHHKGAVDELEGAPSTPLGNAADATATSQQDVASDRVSATRQRLREADQLIPLQRDQRQLEVLSDEEFDAKYALAQRLRAASLEEDERVGMRAIRRTRRTQQLQDELDDMDLDDRRDARRARRQQERATDPRLHLIDLYRERRLAARATSAMIVAGIAWTAVTVHNNLVGGAFPAWEAGLGTILVWFLAFIVEPLASVPLVLVMRAQLKARAYGDGNELRSINVLALEAAALSMSLALCSFPYLPGLGTWQGAAEFISHSLAPIMILLAVITHEVLARVYAARIAEASQECTQIEGTRLVGDSARVVATMAKIEQLMLDGVLEPVEDGYPSMNQMVRCKRLRVAKATLSAARDGLLLLSNTRQGSRLVGALDLIDESDTVPA